MVQVHGLDHGRMDEVPSGSIYFWMYTQGLRHIPIQDIYRALHAAGKEIRQKDMDNYWNGWYNSSLYSGAGQVSVFDLCTSAPAHAMRPVKWEDFPTTPFKEPLPEVQNRWVPCSKENKPLIPWGNGCMSMADAKAYTNQVYLAENTKGTRQVIFDCDGDHNADLDLETIMFLWKYHDMTHCLMKPKALRDYPDGPDSDIPASFHLTFKTDRVIPTMHFPSACIDVIGNEKNSLRYWKNKKWNGLQPAPMTEEVWNEIMAYIETRS